MTLKQKITFLLFLFFVDTSWADDLKKTETLPPPIPLPSETISESINEVEWYMPEIQRSPKKGRARVRFMGRALPGTKVKLSKTFIPLIDPDGNIKTLAAKEAWVGGASVESGSEADAKGNLEINMDLPFTSMQLPFVATTLTGEVKNYILSISVSADDVRLDHQDNIKNSPYSRRKWSIWGGLGMNFLRYDQDMPGISSGVGFQSFTGPAVYTKVVRSLNRDWAVQATLNNSPGKAASSSAVQLSQGSYNWTFLTGELTYFPPRWKFAKKKYFNEFGIQTGFQYHSVPFYSRYSTTDPNAAGVVTNNILMMDIGATSVLHYGQYWFFESFLRYQHPVQSGTLYEISPKFAFDGSIGIVHKWKPDWRLGAFWYGQWQEYNFKNAPDAYSGSKIDGSQSLFFSNWELRVGFEFD